MKYLGHISQKDPLYGYLRYDILSQLGVNGIAPDFRMYSIPASNHVYLYEDRRRRTRLVGRFFGGISNRPRAETMSPFLRNSLTGLQKKGGGLTLELVQ